MKSYDVSIQEFLERSITVEADSISEAIQKGRQLWRDGDIVLDSGDFVDCMIVGTDPDTEESDDIIID